MKSTRHIVECRDLGREFLSPPSRFLLENINFAVESAEVLGVISPSGAGKSSLLRLLDRLDEPTSRHGALQRAGLPQHRYGDPSPVDRHGHAEGIPFPGHGRRESSLRTAPARQDHDRVEIDSLLSEVGLAGYAGHNALALSGGEAQRVAITRALANDPEVLLLDKPTSALDEAARDSVQRLLEGLIRERNLTCIWVTHSLEQARAMADRVLVLEARRVETIGTPAEVLPLLEHLLPDQLVRRVVQCLIAALAVLAVMLLARRRAPGLLKEISFAELRAAADLRGWSDTGGPVAGAGVDLDLRPGRDDLRRGQHCPQAGEKDSPCIRAGADCHWHWRGDDSDRDDGDGSDPAEDSHAGSGGKHGDCEYDEYPVDLLDRFRGEVVSHVGEIETALALGATPDVAVELYLRAAFRASLIPAVDNIRSLGIVWIPGIMAGMVLSGASPLYAALYQFVVLTTIFSSSALACFVASHLVTRRIFSSHSQLLLRA